VTIAHDLPGDVLGCALEEMATYDARFRVWGFSLYEHGPDAVWRPQRDFPLRLGCPDRHRTALEVTAADPQVDRPGGGTRRAESVHSARVVKERLVRGVAGLRHRRPWVDHTVRAYDRNSEVLGGQLAAAVTYYGFLSSFRCWRWRSPSSATWPTCTQTRRTP
jgi:hypothetical protein